MIISRDFERRDREWEGRAGSHDLRGRWPHLLRIRVGRGFQPDPPASSLIFHLFPPPPNYFHFSCPLAVTFCRFGGLHCMGIHLIGILKRRSVLLAALGVLFITAIISSSAGSSYGQLNSHWKIVFQLPSVTDQFGQYQASVGTCGYFWSKQHGLVAAQGPDPKQANTIGPMIWRTTDGINWSQSTIPAYDPHKPYGWITSIYMKNLDTGWASLMAGALTNVLWKTVDGGLTWVVVPGIISGGYQKVTGNPDAEWQTPTGMAEVGGQPSTDSLLLLMIGKIQYSQPWRDAFCSAWIGNVGLIFSTAPWAIQSNGLPPEPPHFYKTIDGGKHRVGIYTNSSFSEEGWGIWGCEKWNAFFMGTNIGPYVSYDVGSSWDKISALKPLKVPDSIRYTMDVEGASDVVYMQTSNNLAPSEFNPDPQTSSHINAGLYRSTDTGHTWLDVGGPSNLSETRFCVFGCHGATVIAFDASGGVWMTEDGGDGKLGNGFAHPLLSDTSLQSTTSVCANIANRFRFHDEHCDAFELDSISFADSTLVRLGALTLDSIPALPKLYGSDDSGFVEYRWTPGAAFTTDTIVTNGIVLHYRSITTGQEYDTTVSLHLVATSGKASHTLSEYELSYLPTGTCSFTDTSFLIRNHGCGKLSVDSIIADGLDYSVLSFDSVLAVNGSGRVVVRFHPSLGGDSHGSLRVHTTQQGVSSWDTLPTLGTGIQGMGILNVFSTSLQAGSFSFCAGDTTLSTSISNTGCDTLRITNIRFAGDATLSYLSSTNDTLLVPDSSKRFSFYFAPRTAGAHSGKLTFHSANLHGNDAGHDTTITIFGTGVPGNVAMSVPITSLTLPQAIAGCTNTSDTIWLFDSLCNNQLIAVDSSRVEGAPRGALTLPITTSSVFGYPPMGNQDSIGIIVYFYPTAADTGVGGASIRVFYHGDDGVEHDSVIAVNANAIPPPKMSVHLGKGGAAAALHAGPGGVITIPIYAHTSTPLAQIASADIASLDIRVWFNTDLITPLSVNVLGQSYDADQQVGSRVPLQYQSDGAFLHLPLPSGFVMTGDSLIATLTCQAFVTDTMQTAIFLDPVSIAADANQDVCFGISSDTEVMSFTLDPVCPDDMLTGFVGTHSFTIESIVPNPASNTITVRVSYLDSDKPGGLPHIGSLHMDVGMYDVLGHGLSPVLSSEAQGRFDLDVSAIPEGSYYLRITSGGEVVTRSFVIRR